MIENFWYLVQFNTPKFPLVQNIWHCMSDFLRILNYRPLFHACVDFIIVVHEHLFQAVRWKSAIESWIFWGKPWNFEGKKSEIKQWNFEGMPLTVKSFFRILANLQRWFLLSRSGGDKKITCHLFITLKIQLSHYISWYKYWIRINFTHQFKHCRLTSL